MSKPFFRADQVGSLLRPPELIAAREQFQHGQIDQAALRHAEDAAIAEVVKRQEACGFGVVVDGEYRRENWWIDFVQGLSGVEIQDGDPAQAFVAPNANQEDHDHDHDHGWKYVPKNVVTTGRLGANAPITAPDFSYLQGVTQRTAKITLPSPTRLHFHGGRAAVSSTAYPDMEEFFADVVKVYQAEIAALEAAGCRYIQIDDPLMTYFISDRMRAEVVASGDDPQVRLQRYVDLTNACIAKRRPDTAIGIHVCRGNSRSGWISEGGYERIADTVLGGLQVDHFLLEYDDERSGDFAPLRHVPRGVKVVLGLVTTKFGRLENADDLVRRIDDASRLVPLDDLGLSPQCGFASTVDGNIITHDDQWRKLERVVEVARRVWGDVKA
ncbi:5-methyltetrahydropteroyltriglutamate--homocysteine S-methyltransferase [Limnohabitans sp.]|uniref:5-methyltetrahydropteroyltriglutamate-- homocysteine S-methyltransferase n=1 Tax=Limnohabitans sp. TaxID=1907725 RepID=UPI0038B9CDB4